MKKDNPLLHPSKLPPFSQIQPQHVVPALEEVLTDNRQQLQQLLQKPTLDWQELMPPLDEMADRLDQMWSPVRHLHAVADNESLRQAYDNCLPKLAAYYTEIGHNQALYKAFVALQQSDDYQQFDTAQRKIIREALRDFKLSGVALSAKDKAHFAELEQQLSQLHSKFEQNVLDATESWSLLIEQSQQLDGLPQHTIERAAQLAKAKEQSGWLLTLDYPCYSAVLSYCHDGEVRRKIYEAYVTRASECGPAGGKYDNSAIIEQILQIRYQLAQMLAFNNYSELSLKPKMAESTEEVLTFLEDLASRVKRKAQSEYDELVEFARTDSGVAALQPWDVAYFSEKLRQQRFNFNAEQLRPWFPLDKVLSGMFDIINKLYGMRVEEQDNIECWHSAVRFFAIYDQQDQLRGSFYIDLYAREGKRGGAWMDECRQRMQREHGLQYPVAYLTCNFTPPVADKPSLLTHGEVITLFHEFGHTLHHLLTQIDYRDVSGINGVPWDAVELPSQFFENFCWHEQTLPLISGHFESGEPLPKALQQQMLAAKQFQAGLMLARQLVFGLFDFKLHCSTPLSNQQTQALLDEVRDNLLPMATPAYNRFQHSFSHIFAGGYCAGYYSYLWAEVLAQDAFDRFLQEGVLNVETGHAFLSTILERGGSDEAMTLFKAFRGRRPKIDALLKSYAISD